MMGYQEQSQSKLFYVGINIEKRIRNGHLLRKTKELIDFDFVYKEVENKYGNNGNVSVAPPIILKLILLFVLYNVRSERELMETLPERLDWLWFLGYDLDSEIPDHSVISKARKRWGAKVFKDFFERIVLQCVEAGLVEGSKIFIDSSYVEANASNNSVIDRKSLKFQLNEKYKELESRLEENEESYPEGKINKQYISTTDPDATIVKRGKSKLMYQVHRTVDERKEIITGTKTTTGVVNEAHVMISLVEEHKTTTGSKAEVVVGDSKYGTIENFLACYERGIKAHIPDIRERAVKGAKKSEIYSEEKFMYDRGNDSYICPAGIKLKRRSVYKEREVVNYAAEGEKCVDCHMREQCTESKSGRRIGRHLRQDELDYMREISDSADSRRDIKTRQHLMERSFAQGKRYGFDRARWRRLWRVEIQEYLTSAIQNILILVKNAYKPNRRVGTMVAEVKKVVTNAGGTIIFGKLNSVSGLITKFCW